VPLFPPATGKSAPEHPGLANTTACNLHRRLRAAVQPFCPDAAGAATGVGNSFGWWGVSRPPDFDERAVPNGPRPLRKRKNRASGFIRVDIKCKPGTLVISV